LIPELSMKVNGKTIRPDGTLQDDICQLHRGYWEAKDREDDLNLEIRKKRDNGYPLFNTIFEDTREGVLYQNDEESYRADLRKPSDLADLLNQFYGHVGRDYKGFEQAADDFKDRVPRIAAKLLEKIVEAHRNNRLSAHLPLNILELPSACGISRCRPWAFSAGGGSCVAGGSAPW
jgi:hypothetical protein